MKAAQMVAFLLVVIGAINWGLVGLFNLDVIATVFGMSAASKLIYILIGASGVYLLVTHQGGYRVSNSKGKK